MLGDMFPDPLTASRMTEQFGLVTRPQLVRELGYSEGAVDGLVHRGRLEAVECGTYRLSGSGIPAEQAAMAAVLRCRPRARVTGAFVLGALGIEGFTANDRFEVLVPEGRHIQNVGFPTRTDPDPTSDRARIGALDAVTVHRAFVDTARDPAIGDGRLLTAIDAAKWRRRTDNHRLLACAERLGRCDAGAIRILRLLDSGELEKESHGERGMGALLSRLEPPVEWQVWVAPHIRVDAFWRDVLLAFEYLGAIHRVEEVRERDADRHAELREAGIAVCYITNLDLREPAATLARISAIRTARLALRDAGLLVPDAYLLR